MIINELTNNTKILEAVNKSNKYSVKFKIGDKVRFIHSGNQLSPQIAKIIGYDKDGFYTLKWNDGSKSDGVGDINLYLIKKATKN